MPQPPQMIHEMSSYPPTDITTEHIHKLLDENKKSILAILDHQILGKLAECAPYQAQLQKNLKYLAAIADAQSQSPQATPSQMTPHPVMQPGGYFMQDVAMAEQPNMHHQNAPLQFNNPHQMQDPQLLLHQLHQQAMQSQMGIRIGGPNKQHAFGG